MSGNFYQRQRHATLTKKPDQTTVGNDNMQSGIHAIIIWKYFYYPMYSFTAQ